jgi:hypothetical protein
MDIILPSRRAVGLCASFLVAASLACLAFDAALRDSMKSPEPHKIQAKNTEPVEQIPGPIVISNGQMSQADIQKIQEWAAQKRLSTQPSTPRVSQSISYISNAAAAVPWTPPQGTPSPGVFPEHIVARSSSPWGIWADAGKDTKYYCATHSEDGAYVSGGLVAAFLTDGQGWIHYYFSKPGEESIGGVTSRADVMTYADEGRQPATRGEAIRQNIYFMLMDCDDRLEKAERNDPSDKVAVPIGPYQFEHELITALRKKSELTQRGPYPPDTESRISVSDTAPMVRRPVPVEHLSHQ